MDSPGAPTRALRRWYHGALVFALVLAVIPAGCFPIDLSMWFVNGAAVAIYGAGMGLAARSRRGVAAAGVCGGLGLTHPVWVLGSGLLNRAIGAAHAAPFSTTAMSGPQIALDNALFFVWTGIVLGALLSAALLSAIPTGVIGAASIAAGAAAYGLAGLAAVSPLGGLWPSGLALPAAILHVGVAVSLWLSLSGASKPLARPAPLVAADHDAMASDRDPKVT